MSCGAFAKEEDHPDDDDDGEPRAADEAPLEARRARCGSFAPERTRGEAASGAAGGGAGLARVLSARSSSRGRRHGTRRERVREYPGDRPPRRRAPRPPRSRCSSRRGSASAPAGRPRSSSASRRSSELASYRPDIVTEIRGADGSTVARFAIERRFLIDRGRDPRRHGQGAPRRGGRPLLRPRRRRHHPDRRGRAPRPRDAPAGAGRLDDHAAARPVGLPDAGEVVRAEDQRGLPDRRDRERSSRRTRS